MEDYKVLKEKNILFLSDIDFTNYEPIEDRLDKEILQSVNDYTYDNIADEYSTSILSNQEINICCWNCTFTFNTEPIFIPTHIKESSDGVLNFGYKGNMCSFNCAMRIIIEITNDSSPDRWRYINNLKILYFIKKGVHISDIKPAPNRTILKMYGGPWTNEMFLNELKKLEKIENINLSIASSEKSILNSISIIQKNNHIHKKITNDSKITNYNNNLILLHKKSNIYLSVDDEKTEDNEIDEDDEKTEDNEIDEDDEKTEDNEIDEDGEINEDSKIDEDGEINKKNENSEKVENGEKIEKIKIDEKNEDDEFINLLINDL